MSALKIKKIIPYFVIVVICTTVFAKPLASGDEFWNYSFAKNIADGLLPYRDFNIIQTPLSAYLSGAVLVFFGKGLLVHRVFGYLLAVSIFGIMYHLCEKISGSSFISFIAVVFVFAVHFPYYIYNYNYLTMLILLIVFEIEANNKGSLGKHLVVGVLTGLTVLSKQSTGVLIVLANLVVCVYYILHSKHNKKYVMARIAMSAVPLTIYSVFLIITGTLRDFWEYAVEGIGTFTHRITPIDLLKSGPGNIVFFLIVFVAYFLIAKRIAKKGSNDSIFSLLVFNVSWIIVVYPLCDASHLLCLLIPLLPLMLSCVECRQYKEKEKYLCIVVTAIVCIVAIIPFLAIGREYTISVQNNYQGVVIDSSVDKRIKTVGKYIIAQNEKGYTVRIVADAACAYKIPLDIYEKNWDMLLVGNIGSNNIKTLLNADSKCVYLVHKDSSVLNEQNYFELIDFIKMNYTKVGEVLNFDVYESPN